MLPSQEMGAALATGSRRNEVILVFAPRTMTGFAQRLAMIVMEAVLPTVAASACPGAGHGGSDARSLRDAVGAVRGRHPHRMGGGPLLDRGVRGRRAGAARPRRCCDLRSLIRGGATRERQCGSFPDPRRPGRPARLATWCSGRRRFSPGSATTRGPSTGRRTTEAVRRFQRDLDLTPDGRLSEKLLMLLMAVADTRREGAARTGHRTSFGGENHSHEINGWRTFRTRTSPPYHAGRAKCRVAAAVARRGSSGRWPVNGTGRFSPRPPPA